MNGLPGKGAPTMPLVDEEDDLPPRMDSTHALPRVAPVPLPKSGTRPSTPSNDPSSHIPNHADFDLNAIKNSLQEVEQNALQAPSLTLPTSPPKSLTRLTLSPTAPPSNRSQSMPPVHIAGTDIHPHANLFYYGYGGSQSPSEDKSPAGMGLDMAILLMEENGITSNSLSSSFARTPGVAHLKSTRDRGVIEQNLGNRINDENHVYVPSRQGKQLL